MVIDPQLRIDFAEVIKYSQNIEEPKIEQLLRDWHAAKNPIMKRFMKNRAIIETSEKVTFNLNEDAKHERLETFIEYTANLLLSMGGWEHGLIRYLQSLTAYEFYSNSLENDYYVNNSKKIQKGTKIVKSFKYFIEDKKLLFDIQNKASVMIQENKVEGYLVFSVHPLDFLSASENCFNWRSCHALDGDYRTGNLSYMCDSSTVVCYLRADEEVKLPHFPETVPWNNKKWRMLLHFNTDFDVVFAGRQYPFTSPGALEIVRKAMVDNLFQLPEYYWGTNKDRWSHWHNDYISEFKYSEHLEDDSSIAEDTYAVIKHGIWNINKIIKDANNSKHFNDLTRSSCYLKPYYMFEKAYGVPSKLKFEIGAEITCLRCGEKTIDGYDSMMCPECECLYGNSDSEEYRTCDCCGIRFYDRNGHWVGDDYVCHNCYENQCFECEECGESYYNAEKNWCEESKQFLCNCCFEERMED